MVTRKPNTRVLVVDDDEIVRRLIETILVYHGFDVIGAADGHHAIEILQRGDIRIDLVITDVLMPCMDGIELSCRLAMSHPALPVMLMSGYLSENLAERLKGRVAFLEKPFMPQTLLSMIRNVLAGRCKPTISDCSLICAG